MRKLWSMIVDRNSNGLQGEVNDYLNFVPFFTLYGRRRAVPFSKGLGGEVI